jgi:hypothetical protein
VRHFVTDHDHHRQPVQTQLQLIAYLVDVEHDVFDRRHGDDVGFDAQVLALLCLRRVGDDQSPVIGHAPVPPRVATRCGRALALVVELADPPPAVQGVDRRQPVRKHTA